MTLQLSVDVQNARLDSIETEIGESPILKIFTGSPPANCATEDSGTLLVTMNLPSNWMLSASGGSISKSGTWEDSSADDSGVAGHFRLYDSDGTTCHMQGTVTATDGGGDIEIPSISITLAETISITSFTIEDGNS